MATLTDTTSYTSRGMPRGNWFTRTESWLDARGKGAWIAAMVLGFIFFWPVHLFLARWPRPSGIYDLE